MEIKQLVCTRSVFADLVTWGFNPHENRPCATLAMLKAWFVKGTSLWHSAKSSAKTADRAVDGAV